MKKSIPEVQDFAQQLALAFLLLAIITGKKGWVILAAFCLIASLGRFGFMQPLAKAWNWLIEGIGRVNRTVILSVFFFVFLSPYAFIFRLFHKQGVRAFLGRKGNEQTAYIETPGKPESRQSFEQLW